MLTDDYGIGSTNLSCIVASYVKFVESAGARAVPLHFDATNDELAKLFHQVNGILIPGGGANIKKAKGNRFREAAEFLFNLALASNDAGDPFPIHATCLGFQLLSVIVAQDDGILCDGCYRSRSPLPLNLTTAARESQLFAGIDAGLLSAITSENITANAHQSGVTPSEYESNHKLREFFQVLSTNTDSDGKPFVSTIEARQYPISATQWHPEKSNFEWTTMLAIPHSKEAVLLSQHVANDLVNRARKSRHRFASSEAERKALIYNFAPVADPYGYFAQVYVWKTSQTVVV
jgi:gamma-glutamyl hydrolase